MTISTNFDTFQHFSVQRCYFMLKMLKTTNTRCNFGIFVIDHTDASLQHIVYRAEGNLASGGAIWEVIITSYNYTRMKRTTLGKWNITLTRHHCKPNVNLGWSKLRKYYTGRKPTRLFTTPPSFYFPRTYELHCANAWAYKPAFRVKLHSMFGSLWASYRDEVPEITRNTYYRSWEAKHCFKKKLMYIIICTRTRTWNYNMHGLYRPAIL
jgi:hypothetical protein